MKQILVTVRAWERRIALVQDNLLQNIYFNSNASQSIEKNFFKGHVAKVLPGVQTAFVDIGQARSGFLHISEIDRDLAFKRIHKVDDDEIEDDTGPSKPRGPSVKSIDISRILKQGESLLVQVSKEPINEKGAKLTTCFTLPGRFVVLMPNIPKIGISKRIVELSERKRLKDLVLSVLPETAGCIIRTTCEGIEEEEIIQDIKYLLGTWDDIQKKYAQAAPQEQVYADIDIMLQVLRDNLDSHVEKIICDDAKAHRIIYDFVKEVAPENAYKVHLYQEKTPLFEKYEIENQIQQALQPKVELSSGGSIVIDSTEAMTVVDVNTGRYLGATKLEETLLKTNMEAATEIVRQLKLRNIGGLIVIDFIDMSVANNRHKLFTHLEQTLRLHDRSQSVVLKVSEFGLVQMTRKRTGKALRQYLMEQCVACRGMGVVRSLSARVHELLRALEHFLYSKNIGSSTGILVITAPAIASYLIDVEYDTLLAVEKQYKLKITVRGDEELCRLYHFEFFS